MDDFGGFLGKIYVFLGAIFTLLDGGAREEYDWNLKGRLRDWEIGRLGDLGLMMGWIIMMLMKLLVPIFRF